MDRQRRCYLHWGIPPPHRWRFLSGWCFTLRHSQFLSSCGLWWIRSCGMALHWGIALSESVFIGDTVTLLDILHWDTLLSLMVVFFKMMAYFETWLLQRLCMHWGMTLTLFWGHILRHNCLIGDGLWFILEHSYLRWFILEHSRHGEYFSWENSCPTGSCTLGHIHLLERDQIGSLHWSVYRVIWWSSYYFMLSSLHTGA